MGRPFFTYMLHCSDDSFYVGQTDDLGRRLVEHDAGATGGYTASRRPVRLVWSEEFSTREEAKAAEVQIKKWSRRKKEGRLDVLPGWKRQGAHTRLVHGQRVTGRGEVSPCMP
jgi:predicted GIY-YIG superfamily endonuclease